jgi:hypothetical protein
LNVAARLSNTKVVIAKIKAIGNNIRGYKIYALFKGYGAAVYIDYEAALETREIIDPFISNTQRTNNFKSAKSRFSGYLSL